MLSGARPLVSLTASCALTALCVGLVMAPLTALAARSGSGSGEGLDRRAVRTLERDLRAHERCLTLAMIVPFWRCHAPRARSEDIEAVSRFLRGLSGLDTVVAHRRETGDRVFDVGLCLLAVSLEVRDELSDRARARSQRAQPSSLVRWLCNGVTVPEWLGTHAALGEDGLCAYAIDGESRVRGASFAHCVRTFAESRLATAGVGPPIRRPNIIVILVDDQRWDTIDATHSPFPELGLPAMPATYTRLAREGLTFTQAVVTTPICGPSRGSFFTGLDPHRHGMLANAGPFGPERFADDDTFATRLDAAGYRTGFLGKYTNGFTELWEPGETPYIPPGWDDFKVFDHPQSVPQTGFGMVENGVVVSYDTPEQPYSTDVLGQHALDFIDASVADASGEPFALWISTTTPHFPWVPAERHQGVFSRLQLVINPNMWEEDVSDKPLWVQLRGLPGSFLDFLGAVFFRRNHLEMQLSTDEMMAALLDRLEAHGAGDDTIIVYTSDNGHAWGEHRWNSKACAWEACLKVPMLLRYPRLVPGPRTESGVVGNVDIVPTLLGLAGADTSGDFDGLDLSDSIRGFEPAPDRDFLFQAIAGPRFTYAGIRRDGLKYFRYQDGSEVLHDLVADPWELENFVDRPEYAETRQEMSARLDEMWPGFDAARSN